MKKIYKSTVQNGEEIKIMVKKQLKGAYLLVDAFIGNKWVPGYYATAFYDGPNGSWINGYISFDWEDAQKLPRGYKYGVWVLTRETDEQLKRIYYALQQRREKEEQRFETFLKRMRKLDAEHLEKIKNYADELLEWRTKQRR